MAAPRAYELGRVMSAENTHLIAGCPGAGKTHRLLGLVEQTLAEGTPPDRIGYVTFGRAAIDDAKRRACSRFDLDRKALPYFGTLHATSLRQLGLSGDVVIGQRHLAELADFANVPISGRRAVREDYYGSQKLPVGDRMLSIIDLARARGVALRDQYEAANDPEIDWLALERFAAAVQTFKRGTNRIDYTDMLELFVEGAPAPLLDVLFVDEAQDLSSLQWLAVRKLATHARAVYVAGDDDQAIYRWNGAAVEQFIALPGHVEVLEQSRRCPRAVQHLAASLAGRLSVRREKSWRARDTEGLVTWHADHANVDLSSGRWLVLARNRYLLEPVLQQLRQDGLLYEVDDHWSTDPGVREAIGVWEKLRAGRSVALEDAALVFRRMRVGSNAPLAPGTQGRMKRALERGPRQVVTIRDLRLLGLTTCGPWHEAMTAIPLPVSTYLRAAEQRGEDITQSPRIEVSTIHAAKGREADNVLLLSDMAARTWVEGQANPDDEVRVFYVGVTRARESLHVVLPRTEKFFDFTERREQLAAA